MPITMKNKTIHRKIIRYRAPSGLRVLGIPLEHTQTMTIMVSVGVGSNYETKKINGISHFLEHMMFKGTASCPTALALASRLDALGATYNAFTDNEATSYYVKTETKNFDAALEIVADMLLHSLYAQEEIDRERGVILGEINMYEDIPQRHVEDIFVELLYKNQPQGRNIAGTKESVKTIGRQDILQYIKKHYRADNTVVAIAGHITSQEVGQVARAFAELEKKKTIKTLPPKELQRSPAMKWKEKKTDQTHLVLGVRAFSLHDKRRYALRVLATILGGTMSSRLFIKVREREGLGYYISSSAQLHSQYGFFSTSAGVDTARLARAVEIIVQEYRDLKLKGVSKEELVRAKKYIEGNVLVNLETSDAFAHLYAHEELLEGNIETPDQYIRKIQKVSLRDVQNVARDIFLSKNINLALIGPEYSQAKLYNILKKL